MGAPAVAGALARRPGLAGAAPAGRTAGGGRAGPPPALGPVPARLSAAPPRWTGAAGGEAIRREVASETTLGQRGSASEVRVTTATMARRPAGATLPAPRMVAATVRAIAVEAPAPAVAAAVALAARGAIGGAVAATPLDAAVAVTEADRAAAVAAAVAARGARAGVVPVAAGAAAMRAAGGAAAAATADAAAAAAERWCHR
mmetsp:Transcript_61364/g.197736  ORF Transcript_61364/g.197736 Transcript_61364/m.197736 type:complete len:202 (-) Transcript_61364:115-720(-)